MELFYVLTQVYSSRTNLNNNAIASQKIFYEIIRDEFVHVIQATAAIAATTNYQI